MAELILGPLLRYVGTTDASIWVETDSACEVEVLGRTAETFCVAGHHFALVFLENLEPGTSEEYEVALDGEQVWPPSDSEFPPSVLRTFREEEQVELVFGSCRVAAPQGPPFTLPKEVDEEKGRGFDALHALALSILEEDSPSYPDLLFLCGDQVYADEVSIRTLEFIAEREDRPPGAPPDQVADFEEYTRLYRESWSEPGIRWLLSTVSSSMVIDDHDMHDDWNISQAWCEEMERKEWWHQRVLGGMASYWVYQFIGNLPPAELRNLPLWQRVQENREDAEAVLREFMDKDDQEREGKRWSYYRDLGSTRLIVADVRTGRCLDEGDRKIIDDDEWDWIVERATEGEFDHLLIGTSDPYLLAPAFHHLEAWSERVCNGRWGSVCGEAGGEGPAGARFRPLGCVLRFLRSADRAAPRAGDGRARCAARHHRRPLRRRPPCVSGRGGVPAGHQRAKPGLSGGLLAVPQRAGYGRAPRHPCRALAAGGGADPAPRTGGRGGGPRNPLALHRGPVLRQPGRDPEARWTLLGAGPRQGESRPGGPRRALSNGSSSTA